MYQIQWLFFEFIIILSHVSEIAGRIPKAEGPHFANGCWNVSDKSAVSRVKLRVYPPHCLLPVEGVVNWIVTAVRLTKIAENQRSCYVHGIQMLSGLYVHCFGDSLVEDVSVLVHDIGCSGIVRLKCDGTRVRSVDCWQLMCAHQR